MYIFENLNNLSTNKFQLNFYQTRKEWKRELLHFEFNQNNSERVVDSGVFRNQCVLIKRLHVFSGKKDCTTLIFVLKQLLHFN